MDTTPPEKKTVPKPHLPIEMILNIYRFLPKNDILSGKCLSKALKKELSSFRFSSNIRNNSSPDVLLFKDDTFSILSLDHPPTTQVIYTKPVTVPSIISERLLEDRVVDEFSVEFHDNIKFHGSTGGLVCLSINESGYIIWNPSTGNCIEIPKLSTSDLDFGFDSRDVFAGMGDSGEGTIQIACIGTSGGVMPDIGTPIIIHLLSVQDPNPKWVTVDTEAVFMGRYPCYVGVAGDVLLWSCPLINPEALSGYNFRTKSVININLPYLGPPHMELAQLPIAKTEKKKYGLRLYVGANLFWALGEDTNTALNYFRRYVAGAWEKGVDAFQLPDQFGLIDSLIGSTSDFSKLLLSSNEDHLLLFHSIPQGDDHPITLVDSPDSDSDRSSANSVSQTDDFMHVRSIQFDKTLFFPDVAPVEHGRDVGVGVGVGVDSKQSGGKKHKGRIG